MDGIKQDKPKIKKKIIKIFEYCSDFVFYSLKKQLVLLLALLHGGYGKCFAPTYIILLHTQAVPNGTSHS